MRRKLSLEAGITQDAGSGADLVLKPGMVFLFSLISALSVANVYASQPLLESIALTLNTPQGQRLPGLSSPSTPRRAMRSG